MKSSCNYTPNSYLSSTYNLLKFKLSFVWVVLGLIPQDKEWGRMSLVSVYNIKRLSESIGMGVEIQCCSQTMANERLSEKDPLPGIKVTGAMNVIVLASKSCGTLCF